MGILNVTPDSFADGGRYFDPDAAIAKGMEMFRQGAALVDVCRALDCGDESRIDRVLVRSSTAIELTPVAWAVDDRFVDPDGNQLSDHEPVGVTIGWRWLGD